jgi:hypothetical protein
MLRSFITSQIIPFSKLHNTANIPEYTQGTKKANLFFLILSGKAEVVFTPYFERLILFGATKILLRS